MSDTNLLTFAEVKKLGFEWADGIGQEQLASALEKYGSEGQDEVEMEYYEQCYGTEDNARQYSPFEHTARVLNDLADQDIDFEPWDAFQCGISNRFEEYFEANYETAYGLWLADQPDENNEG
jgi:phosphoglycolate phosphatase-like HAD superfamily hydrolase